MGRTGRVWTSNSSPHAMRRLISYLHQPETKVSRRGPASTGVRAVPAAGTRGVVRPYKSAPYMGIGLHRAGLDITCVGMHHEAPAELPRSPGDDGAAAWALRPSVRTPSPLPRTAGPPKPYESAAYMGFGLHCADFDIGSVDTHHGAPAELSRSPGDDGMASRSLQSGVRARSHYDAPSRPKTV